MALKAFRADPFTRSELARTGLEELSRNLWPGKCQTCGSSIEGDIPSVVIVDDELSVTATLHHSGCQRPRWSRTGWGLPRRYLSTTTGLIGVPFGDPARDPFVPTLIVNPGLEEVTLAVEQTGRYRATTVAAYRPWGLVAPQASIPRGIEDQVACWVDDDALIVRCGQMFWRTPLDESAAGGVAEIRRRDEVMLGISTALDPARLCNPEPVKRVLRTHDIALIRAPISSQPAPVLTGHSVVVESELAHADETRDSDWLPDKIPYRGPTYDPATGRFALGTGMDGPSYWTLNTPGAGVENGLLAGPPEMGKSNALRIVLLEALCSGLFRYGLIDPADRNKLADILANTAERVAHTPRDALRLLAWFAAVVDERLSTGDRCLDPISGRPGLLLAVDDAHQVLRDPAAAELAERIAVAGPPVGVGLVVAGESVDVRDFGGRPQLLRALIKTNCMVFDREQSMRLHRLLNEL